ncbi:MAG: Gfo/Idh/MocA family protein, partial [Verrucomicrobiales bacterium]
EVLGIVVESDQRWEEVKRHKAYQGLRRLSLREALDGPARLIAVETSIAEAPTTALRCLEAGKHLHLDKPGALKHADFQKLRLLARDRELVVQMGYMLRYNPAFELLFRAVREGWLGEITSIQASMGKLAGPALRRELAGLPGGGMFELACHLIDAVLTVLGPPEKIHAHSTPTQDDGVSDNQLAVLQYPRATATIHCNHADPFGAPHRFFHVIGTRGSLAISPLESGKGTLSLTAAHGGYAKGRHDFALAPQAGRYHGEFTDLAQVLRGQKKLAWDAAHDIRVHRAVLAASGLQLD